MSRVHQNEQGAVLAIVALSLIALLGMAALVIDVGGLLVAKRRMVSAADSAALAAAQECANDPATHNFGTAKAEAQAVAVANGATAGKIAVTSGACGTARGEITARYRVPEHLSFAPLLGLGESLTVSAPAKAIWGPARGTRSTPPVNLFAGAGGSTFPCAFEPAHPCNFWFDNTSQFNSSSSNWSFLALGPPGWPADVAGNDPQRGCPNNDAGMLPGWTLGLPTRLIARPTFVCAVTGNFGTSGNSPMSDALEAMEGKTFQFPVSDPALRPSTTSGREKFAIVGFTTLRIVEVLRGNDPAISGASGSCVAVPHTFLEPPPAGGDTYNASVAYAACDAIAPANAVLGDPIIKRAFGGQTYSIAQGDFVWDIATKMITAFSDFPNGGPDAGTRAVEISFPWGTPGPCGFRDPNDPGAANNFCIITEWRGNELGGTDPDPDPTAPDFGTRAVRLSE